MTNLNKYSSKITQPKSQGASQAMLYGTGMTADDMNKAQVGIASVWYEGNTCNMHLNDLADEVKKGVTAAGLVGMRFNTIGVSDGISMGTEGMCYSLQSRDLIADSIETVMGGQWYDALIALPGCDKNMPGCLMAMGRLNRPAIMVYGGTIRAGCTPRHPKLDVVSAFQAYGEFITGKITEEERAEIIRCSIPGAGACGGMYTANTMSSAIEALGMSLPYSSSIPGRRPAQSRRMHRRRQSDPQSARKRPQAARHHDPRGLRERDDHRHGPRRLHQRRAPPHRHGPLRQRESHDRRLPKNQRPRPLHRRPQAQRQIRHGRPPPRRRHSRRHEIPAGKRLSSTATA